VQDLAPDRAALLARIAGPLARRHSTATVLFHHAVAERLGLGPTDHKCLDLLLERGSLTASELAAATGLTSGAIAGVVARLESGGRLRREPHPDDRRKQVLRPVEEGLADVRALFASFGDDTAELLDDLDDHQLAGVAAYLERAVGHARRRAALLRAERHVAGASPATDHGGPR
jgi:DNA-binding MarR family transcriptional regulator